MKDRGYDQAETIVISLFKTKTCNCVEDGGIRRNKSHDLCDVIIKMLPDVHV